MYEDWINTLLMDGRVGRMAYFYQVGDEPTYCYSPPCYADLYNQRRPIQSAFFRFGYDTDGGEKVALRYLDWLLSPEVSPWRKVVPNNPDKSFIMQKGLLLAGEDLHKPTAGMQSFLQAYRFTMEFPKMAVLWDKLTTAGVHPVVAYAVTCLVSQRNGHYELYNPGNTNHLAFNPCMSLSALKNMAAGEFRHDPDNLFCKSARRTKEERLGAKNGGSLWLCDIWEVDGILPDIGRGFIADILIKAAKEQATTTAFGKSVGRVLSFTELVKACNSIEKEL